MAKFRTQLPKSPTGVKVVDLLENPQLVRGDQILATPTLERKLPLPIRRIIGDLSNTKRVLVGLDLRNKA
jgi:circadian clock protein KaiB